MDASVSIYRHLLNPSNEGSGGKMSRGTGFIPSPAEGILHCGLRSVDRAWVDSEVSRPESVKVV